MEARFLPTFTVPICFGLAVIIRVGMSLVVLESIDVLVFLVAVWMGTVNEDRGGTVSVYNGGFRLGPWEGASG